MYFHVGDYRRAIEDHDHFLRLSSGFHTDNAKAHYGRAWALYQLGRNSDALDDADRALALTVKLAADLQKPILLEGEAGPPPSANRSE